MIPKKRSSPTQATAKAVSLKSTSIRNHHRPSKQKRRNQPFLLQSVCFLVLFVLVWTLALLRYSRASRILQSQQLLHDEDESAVVHVIQTRFMQFQPHLLALGWARLRLFQAITFPSVTSQTTQEFLWIVRADPDLEGEVREELIQTLAPFQNIILVGSNDNAEGFRGPECIADITSSSLWSGSLELVQSYWKAAQTHTLLETRLDADDALLVDYFEMIQADARLRLQQPSQPDNAAWAVWCAENHMEWQYDSPWNSNDSDGNSDDSNGNATTATPQHGALVGLNAGFCVTAGLSWGYAVHTTMHDTGVVVRKHQEIHKAVPKCSSLQQTQCLIRVDPPGKLPAALRARTPTSAGMEHVILGESGQGWERKLRGSRWKSSQKELFEQLPVLFGMEAQQLWDVRDYFKVHISEIAEDAISGQCTKGHSCKKAAKKALKKILDKTTGYSD